MKKIILSAILLLGIVATTFAQTPVIVMNKVALRNGTTVAVIILGGTSTVNQGSNPWVVQDTYTVIAIERLLAETTSQFKEGQLIGNTWFSVAGSSVDALQSGYWIVDSTSVVAKLQEIFNLQNSTTITSAYQAGYWIVDSTSVVGKLQDIYNLVNSTANTKDSNYDVLVPTYCVITAVGNGTGTVYFEADVISAYSMGGDNTFNIGGGQNITCYNANGYTTPERKKRYINPTLNWTVTAGTMTIVIEGYLPK